jgi:phosphoribosyl 1,2-cyclic phosphodiesterase
VLSRVHRQAPEELIAVGPGDHFKVDGLAGRATYSKHSDETTVGFRFTTGEGVIGYIADTQLEEDLIKAHRGSRLLVVPATRPRGKRIRWHLCADDVVTLLSALRPEVAVLNHLGLKMIRAGPGEEAAWIEKATGVRTIAALDGMTVRMADQIEVVPPSATANAPAPPLPNDIAE